MRPNPFKFLEFLYTGLFGLLLGFFAVYCALHGVAAGPVLLLAGMSLLAVGINVVLVIARWRLYQSYDLVLPFGILVARNGYHVTPEILEAEIARVVRMYRAFVPRIEAILAQEPIFVTFRPGVMDHPMMNGKVKLAGSTAGSDVQVAYYRYTENAGRITGTTVDPDVPIEQTAFAHELGHVIIGRAQGIWDNNLSHAWMVARKLP